MIRAFRTWLVSSWQSPYAIRSTDAMYVSADDHDAWENYCFQMAVSLAENLEATPRTTVAHAPGSAEFAIGEASYFLCHPTIAKRPHQL